MRIIQLCSENVKRLRAVEITPSGHIVTIAGKNAQGKSSILDSIYYALAGAGNIPAQPIRKGEKKARIRLCLGGEQELIVERRFTESGSTLIVENAQGARFQSPQKMLDALLGELSFDPLAFARMKPRDQYDELRRIVKLDINIDDLDGQNRADFGTRTEINRDVKAKRAQAEAITVTEGLPETAVDESDLLDRITNASEKNTLIEQRRARRQQAARDVQAKRDHAATKRAEAARLIQEAEALETAADSLQQELSVAPTLPELVDVTDLRAQLDQAKMVNQQIAQRDRRIALEREAAALEAQSQNFTEQMEAREKIKADAIAAASMPVPGLGFGDGVVTYNGIPLEQASTAEQLRVSVAIAMAANPRLRVIRIQDGSLLDENSLSAIADMAKAGDYQVWVETVRTDGKVGIVIEDGAVVAVDGEPVEPAEPAAA